MKPVSSRQSDEPVDRNTPRAYDEILLQAVRHARAGLNVEENFRLIDGQLRPRLFGYFRANFFSTEDAEDLVQKTLTQVYLGMGQLEHEEKFMGWLFAIARNVRITAIKRQQHENHYVADGVELAEQVADPQQADWALNQQLEEERLAAVGTAIDQLPAQQRQCLLLRVREELSYEDIAETLRLSVNTVRNHLAEAKKNLRRMLVAQFEGDIAI
jgi:RNA polymerase sigma-70 factor (ECF subfamily)